jgi:hypothetical protein
MQYRCLTESRGSLQSWDPQHGWPIVMPSVTVERKAPESVLWENTRRKWIMCIRVMPSESVSTQQHRSQAWFHCSCPGPAIRQFLSCKAGRKQCDCDEAPWRSSRVSSRVRIRPDPAILRYSSWISFVVRCGSFDSFYGTSHPSVQIRVRKIQ